MSTKENSIKHTSNEKTMHHCEELDRVMDTLVTEHRERYYFYDSEKDERYGGPWNYCIYCGAFIGVISISGNVKATKKSS